MKIHKVQRGRRIICSNKLCANWMSIGDFMVMVVDSEYDSSKQQKIRCPICHQPAIMVVKKTNNSKNKVGYNENLLGM